MLCDLLLSHAFRSICILVAAILAEIGIIILDVKIHGAITGLSLVLVCVTLALASLAFVNQGRIERWAEARKFRRDHRRRRKDPLRYLDRRRESGLSDFWFLLLAVLCFTLLLLTFAINARAEGGDLSRMLIEETARQWPRVPLNAAELQELQDLNLRLRVLAESLADAPADAGPGIREKRLFLRRKLESASESIVDVLVAHASALVRQGGAR